MNAASITITGVGVPITLTDDNTLTGFVFSGPDLHVAHSDRTRIDHALLLHTIYAIPESVGDIRPVMDTPVAVPDGANDLPHACDLERDSRVGLLVPPDSEYCPNYDELP